MFPSRQAESRGRTRSGDVLKHELVETLVRPDHSPIDHFASLSEEGRVLVRVVFLRKHGAIEHLSQKSLAG